MKWCNKKKLKKKRMVTHLNQIKHQKQKNFHDAASNNDYANQLSHTKCIVFVVCINQQQQLCAPEKLI